MRLVYEEQKPSIEEILTKKSARLLRNPLEIPFRNDYGGMLQSKMSKSSNYRILDSKFPAELESGGSTE